MAVKLLYFAWVREKVGRAEEMVDMPSGVETVADLVTWMKGRGENYQEAFARADVIRVALDRNHVRGDARIGSAREIAFFPPVTGG